MEEVVAAAAPSLFLRRRAGFTLGFTWENQIPFPLPARTTRLRQAPRRSTVWRAVRWTPQSVAARQGQGRIDRCKTWRQPACACPTARRCWRPAPRAFGSKYKTGEPAASIYDDAFIS